MLIVTLSGNIINNIGVTTALCVYGPGAWTGRNLNLDEGLCACGCTCARVFVYECVFVCLYVCVCVYMKKVLFLYEAVVMSFQFLHNYQINISSLS